jgi:hypothetical protein
MYAQNSAQSINKTYNRKKTDLCPTPVNLQLSNSRKISPKCRRTKSNVGNLTFNSTKIRDLSKKIQELRQDLNRTARFGQTLTQNLTKLQKSEQLANERNQVLELTTQQQTQEIEFANKKIEEMRENNIEIRIQLQNITNERDELSERVKELEINIAKAKNIITQLQIKQFELQQKLTGKEEEIKNQQNIITALELEQTVLRRKLKKLEDENEQQESLKTQIEKTKQISEEKDFKISQLQTQLKELQKSLEQKNKRSDQIFELNQLIEKLQKNIQNSKTIILQLRTKLTEKQKKFCEQNQKLKKQIAASTEKQTLLEKNQQISVKEKEELALELEKNKKELTKINTKSKKLQQDLGEARQKLTIQESALQNFAQEKLNLTQQIEKLKIEKQEEERRTREARKTYINFLTIPLLKKAKRLQTLIDKLHKKYDEQENKDTKSFLKRLGMNDSVINREGLFLKAILEDKQRYKFFDDKTQTAYRLISTTNNDILKRENTQLSSRNKIEQDKIFTNQSTFETLKSDENWKEVSDINENKQIATETKDVLDLITDIIEHIDKDINPDDNSDTISDSGSSNTSDEGSKPLPKFPKRDLDKLFKDDSSNSQNLTQQHDLNESFIGSDVITRYNQTNDDESYSLFGGNNIYGNNRIGNFAQNIDNSTWNRQNRTTFSQPPYTNLPANNLDELRQEPRTMILSALNCTVSFADKSLKQEYENAFANLNKEDKHERQQAFNKITELTEKFNSQQIIKNNQTTVIQTRGIKIERFDNRNNIINPLDIDRLTDTQHIRITAKNILPNDTLYLCLEKNIYIKLKTSANKTLNFDNFELCKKTGITATGDTIYTGANLIEQEKRELDLLVRSLQSININYNNEEGHNINLDNFKQKVLGLIGVVNQQSIRESTLIQPLNCERNLISRNPQSFCLRYSANAPSFDHHEENRQHERRNTERSFEEQLNAANNIAENASSTSTASIRASFSPQYNSFF